MYRVQKESQREKDRGEERSVYVNGRARVEVRACVGVISLDEDASHVHRYNTSLRR